jgi:hypothetical protein
MRKSLLSVLASMVFVGCSSVPRYVNEKKPSDAQLRWDNDKSAILAGNVSLSIVAIDGVRLKVMRKVKDSIFVRPGKREVEIWVGGIYLFQKVGGEFLELEFEPEHSYFLKPSVSEGNFVVEFFDETDAKSVKLLKTTKVKGSRPMILPLPVPVK